MSESEARNFLAQLVSVFVKIHALGYVHRDLKLDNIFIKKEAGKKVILVGDFGQARKLASPDQRMKGM